MTNYKEEATAIVRKHGTPNEVERLDAGVLPEQEFDKIVADVLFKDILPLVQVRRREKEESVRRHAMNLGQATASDPVSFELVEDSTVDALSAEQWELLKQIKSEMPLAEVKVLWVVAECGRYFKRRAVARVSVQLAERTKSLDVMLKPPERQPPTPEVLHRRAKG